MSAGSSSGIGQINAVNDQGDQRIPVLRTCTRPSRQTCADGAQVSANETICREPAPTVPPTEPTRRPRLVWLSVVLLLLGLTGGFLAGLATAPEAVLPADLAGPEITAMLDDLMEAINSGDEATLESLFAQDATFTDTTKDDGNTVQGNDEIGQALGSFAALGFRASDPGTAIHNGDYVAQYHLASSGRSSAGTCSPTRARFRTAGSCSRNARFHARLARHDATAFPSSAAECHDRGDQPIRPGIPASQGRAVRTRCARAPEGVPSEVT